MHGVLCHKMNARIVVGNVFMDPCSMDGFDERGKFDLAF